MSGYIGTQPVPQATQTRDSFTATSGQTSFATGGYTPNFLDVYLNGVKLASADYTATNGSDVVLASGAATGDILEVVAYTAFDTANVTGATNFTVTGAFTSQGIDDNGNATALTIDSSENVMLNTTNTSLQLSSSDEGFTYANNFTTVSRDGGTTAYFNRLSSDGDIVVFRKDGSDVGSIGTIGGGMFVGDGDVGLEMDGANNAIYPFNTSTLANTDNHTDLGDSDKRFKDAYLSGGVYLGGTGSANKLDSYEEGTWTPVFSDEASGGNTATGSIRGLYTKIGNQVTVTCTAIGLSTSGMNSVNDLRIQGLPFTPSSYTSPNNYWTGATRFKNVSFNTNGWVSANVLDATTYVRLTETVVGTANDNIIVSQILSSADVYFTLTYQTNS